MCVAGYFVCQCLCVAEDGVLFRGVCCKCCFEGFLMVGLVNVVGVISRGLFSSEGRVKNIPFSVTRVHG